MQRISYYTLNVWVAAERTDCDIKAAFDGIIRSLCRKQVKDVEMVEELEGVDMCNFLQCPHLKYFIYEIKSQP